MRIFTIGDLHLSGGDDKPMDVFGSHWENHFERIKADWTSRIQPNDLVLIPGDISWAMAFENALPDLFAIGRLPGKKVLLRGNHDYWWPGIGQLRSALPQGMYALQNDALRFEDVTVCGSRLWLLPALHTAKDDKKIYDRELIRLRLSLESAQKLGGRMIVMTHYPPASEEGTANEVTRLIAEFGVQSVVYAHLHGPACKKAFCGTIDGIPYHCVSCDFLNFKVHEIQL